MNPHKLININSEAYKYKHSDAPSRSMCGLNDIISKIYILFLVNGKPRISSFQLYAECKDKLSYFKTMAG